MSSRAVGVFVLLLVLCGVNLSAQSPAPSDSLPPPRRIGLGFERNINTYLWTLNGTWDATWGPWRLALGEDFRRTLIRADREYLTDEQRATLVGEYRWDSQWAVTADLSGYLFADSRSTALNDLLTQGLKAGLRWTPLSFLSLASRVGYVFDTQRGIHDEGLAWDAFFSLTQPDLGPYRIQASGSLASEDLDPRSHYERRFSGSVHSSFSGGGSNLFQIEYRGRKRDVYVSLLAQPEPAVESRVENTVLVGDQLHYALSDPLALTAGGEVGWRSISRDRSGAAFDPSNPFFPSDVEELRLSLRGALRYENRDGALIEIQSEWLERPEEHLLRRAGIAGDPLYPRYQKLEEQKDNTITQSTLALQMRMVPGAGDTVGVQASTVKLRYDTPSALNYDDRDELVYLAGLAWLHRISPSVLAGLTGDLAFRHTVYIYRQRSANNMWNRVLRLSPSVQVHRPGSFSTRVQGEVLANYTVYDFEKRNPALGSYYLRQFSLADSTVLSLSRVLELRTWVLLRVYERGSMRWDEFTVQPASLFDERSLSFECAWVKPGWSLAAGFRFFQQQQAVFEGGDWRKRGQIRTLGPTCRCLLGRGEALLLSIEGWYQYHTSQGGETKTTPNVALSVLWNL